MNWESPPLDWPPPSPRPKVRPHVVTWFALIVTGASLYVGTIASACTPADRATVRAVVDATAPLGCALAALVAPDGSPAGLVCSDVHGILDRLLATTPAATVATVRGAARACTPRPLPMPGRDPREYVCAEAIADVDLRRALEVGRAK